ncbi:MAG: hypothetical protein ABSG34_09640 [Candidatus Sulfotelmatobacter sp.]|jgi:hypothetical protein
MNHALGFGLMISSIMFAPAMSTPAMAQSPFDGAWRLDNSDSQPSTMHYDYLLQDGIYHCTSCDPPIDVPADGQDHKITGEPCYDTVSVKVVDERTTDETDKRNGKIVGTLRMTVSADGKAATEEWTESCNAKGDIVAGQDIMGRLGVGPSRSHAISGSWKILKRLKRSENALMITMKLVDHEFTFADPTGQGYTAKLDGTETPIKGDISGALVSVKLINERTIEETVKHEGKVNQVTRFVISADGKVLTIFQENRSNGTTRQFVAHKQ